MSAHYDDKEVCQDCGGSNTFTNCHTDGDHLSEVDTECSVCGRKDYWAYGFFLSEPPLSLVERLLNLVGWYKVVSWWRKLTDTKGSPFNF